MKNVIRIWLTLDDMQNWSSKTLHSITKINNAPRKALLAFSVLQCLILLLVINQMPHSLLFSQASKLPDHHTASPTQTSSNSSMTQFPSTSPSTTQQTLSQKLPQPFPQVQAQSSDRSTPPHLTSTMEHIVGQLDILTQVREMRVFS